MYLLVFIVWCLITVVIARVLSRRFKTGWTRVVTFSLFVPIILVLPVLDELIGKFQFDQLCEEAKEIKIFATKPVGEELYFPDGRWRLTSSPLPDFREINRMQAVYESMVRYEQSDLQVLGTMITIRGHETRIFDRKSGQLLASYKIYATHGGWLGRWGSETPLIVRAQCLPQSFSSVGQRILRFSKNGEGK